MDQQANTHTSETWTDARAVSRDAVLCRISQASDITQLAQAPESLEKLGFTGVVLPSDLTDTSSFIEALKHRGIDIYQETELLELPNAMDLSAWSSADSRSAANLWVQLEHSAGISIAPMAENSRHRSEVAAVLQMAAPLIPIVPMSDFMISTSQTGTHREQRELLRSLIFWRKRFGIPGHSPQLVHAGEDGLLIFTIDSWLIALNQNEEESSIDLGSHGSMWLMLGTQRDVHLHGSLLILPEYSGAIVANELAR